MRVRIGVLAALFVLVTTSVALAWELLTLEATTPPPHIVGNAITFVVTWNGPQPQTFDWDWRCTEGGVTSLWSQVYRSTTPIFAYQDPYVGSYDQRCKATWLPYPPPGGTSQIIRPFSTVGPNNDVLTQGNGVESTGYPTMSLMTKWQVRYQGTRIGGYATAVPGERVHESGEPWSDWADGNVPGVFYYNNATAEICDLKTITPVDQAGWDSIPVGTVLFDIYQQNRVKIKNCHGDWVTFEFGVHHFQQKKASATSWKLVSLD